uniref:Uncharacterized protein n=1 Tax=Moniliophthora roreri TaxID=221103 RepID=A0A0W0FWZ1_MONRR
MQLSFISALYSLLLLNMVMLASGLPAAIGNQETNLSPNMPLEPTSSNTQINKEDPKLLIRGICAGV